MYMCVCVCVRVCVCVCVCTTHWPHTGHTLATHWSHTDHCCHQYNSELLVVSGHLYAGNQHLGLACHLMSGRVTSSGYLQVVVGCGVLSALKSPIYSNYI